MGITLRQSNVTLLLHVLDASLRGRVLPEASYITIFALHLNVKCCKTQGRERLAPLAKEMQAKNLSFLLHLFSGDSFGQDVACIWEAFYCTCFMAQRLHERTLIFRAT